MSDSDQSSGGAGQPLREVPIDWEALEDAFENNAPEVHSYLHLSTGEVLRVVDGIADPEMHQRIASDTSYLRIEPVSSREQYRWMERFIPMVEDEPLSGLLTQAIDGKGAFRRFKDVLMSHGAERERWFAFRSERLRVFMEAWLTAHALKPTPRVVWPSDTAPKETREAEVATPQDAAARRTRSIDGQRKQLHELIESLSARDLDKVMAFAEFVKARRSARGFAREGSHDSVVLEAASAESDAEASPAPLTPSLATPATETKLEVTSTAVDEEATPSSRKRPAAR